jgi:hypothetical protein
MLTDWQIQSSRCKMRSRRRRTRVLPCPPDERQGGRKFLANDLRRSLFEREWNQVTRIIHRQSAEGEKSVGRGLARSVIPLGNGARRESRRIGLAERQALRTLPPYNERCPPLTDVVPAPVSGVALGAVCADQTGACYRAGPFWSQRELSKLTGFLGSAY